MNKEELQNKISELEETLWHLQEELEDMKEQEKDKIWKPAEDEPYWYVAMDGEICKSVNTLSTYDISTIDFGNCYPTEEKAEFEANREKYTRLFRQYVEQHSAPLDWGNDDQPKYYIDWFEKEDVQYNYSFCCQTPFVIYASSKEVLQEAIAFIGEDNFKRFILQLEN